MEELGLDALDRLCQGRVYRNWQFTVEPLVMDYDRFGPMGILRVAYPALDAYNPTTPKTQRFTATIPREIDAHLATADRWIPWLFSVIAYLEHHEAFEFFMPGGKRVFDPHDPAAVEVAASYGFTTGIMSFLRP